MRSLPPMGIGNGVTANADLAIAEMSTLSEALPLAIQHHQAGRLQEAEVIYRQVLEVQPGNADALHLLGVIKAQAGSPNLAVELIDRALQVRPDWPAAIANLGQALSEQGRLDDAIRHLQRALQLKPDFAQGHDNLGTTLRKQGNLPEAVACYRRALELMPGNAATHNNLSIVLKDQGKLDEAITCCRRALELKPDYAQAHNNLGNVFREQGNLDEAIACYHRAMKLTPDVAEVHNNLGVALKEQGQLDEAITCFRRALQLKPNYGEALAALAELLRARLPADELALLAHLASSPEVSVGGRASVHFGMAAVKDAAGDYAAAAQHLMSANSLRLADHRAHGRAYDPDAYDQWVADVIDVFSVAYFERVRGFGVDSERPVFIFGLPRTGTTLTEQILASHSQVFGAGELRLAGIAFNSLPEMTMNRGKPLECVAALDRQVVDVVARQYLDRLEALDSKALRIVDKLPDNFLLLGFLATLFPQARFLHCRRDVRDVALSCWMTNFRQVHWSTDINHIAARFRAYKRLMEHWRRVLPVRIIDVDYETTVADVEDAARRLIDSCGLDWEPQCLSFHTRRGSVRTASVAQVRQPIYQHSVGRWKRYESFLAPLFAVVSDRHVSKIDPRTHQSN